MVVSVANKGDESEDSVVVKPLTQEPVVRAYIKHYKFFLYTVTGMFLFLLVVSCQVGFKY